MSDRCELQLLISRFAIAIAAALALAIGTDAIAQSSDDPPRQSEDDPGQRNEADSDEEDDDRPASLDELLGLDEEEDDVGDEDAQQDGEISAENDEALQRRLNEQNVQDALAETLANMAVSADRLETNLDPGLTTQRAQEAVLDRLDQLIDFARQNARRQQSGGSSSSTQQQDQQQQRDVGRRPGQTAERQSAPRPGQPTGESTEAEPPPPEQPNPNQIMEEDTAEWGNLPQRVRDLLLQGRAEQFSSLYEQLTREYYRRLAEEGSR